jgi:cell wall-associated NlpC family hydrolase
MSITFAALLAVPAVAGQATAQTKTESAQKKLQDLNTQVDVLVQKYDKSQEQLTQAQRKLAVMKKQFQAEQANFNALHEAVAQMAAAAYKTGGTDDTGVTTLLSAKDPSTMLDQMSLTTAVSQNRSSELAQVVTSAQRLQLDQGQAQQAVTQITQTRASLKTQRAVLEKQVAAQKKLIPAASGPTPVQGTAARKAAGGPTPSQGTCNIQASGKALTAIRFACSKLGTPYLWGGTGPRYDCSGLTQAAWAAAGISLPRTTSEQWTVYTRVSYSQLQPGDLVFFYASLGHVGMYLGGGKMIHSPHTGDVVKISDISSGTYRSQFQGGVHIA